jgi:carboxymethylenebutenolidase
MEDKKFLKAILQWFETKGIFIIALIVVVNIHCKNSDKDTPTGMAMFVGDKEFQQIHETPTNVAIDSTGEMVDFVLDDKTHSKAFFIKSSEANKTLIVFHEWWGLNGHIKKTCQDLSKQLPKVNILALDLYDGKLATTPDEAGVLMKNVTEEHTISIIKGAINFFAKNQKIASLGWCFGGGWSLQTAILSGDAMKACVLYYGLPELEATKVNKIKSPVLGIFATNDAWITPDLVSQFDDVMKATNKDFKYYSFAAEHAFANPSGSRYNEKAAKEANKIVIDFLRQKLED